MSRIFVFLMLTCIAMTLAHPVDDRPMGQGVLLERLERSADPGYGRRHGGYRGGYRRFGSGGNSFSQSSANAASINTPFGSASFASANANAGGYGR